MICRALLVLLALAGSASAGCPLGNWFHREGFCYYPSAVEVSWIDARTLCRSMGAELVSIADQAENTYVAAMSVSNTGIWIGLNDIVTEGVYSWSDGSSSAYTNWRPGEPHGGTSYNCVYLYTGSGTGYMKWYDNVCTYTHYFMCKMEDLSTSSSAQSDITAGAE